MTMDTSIITTTDIIFIGSAIAVSFMLGGLRRLVRHIGDTRFETQRAGADLRDYVDRNDEQVNRVRRLQDELDELKAALSRSAGRSQDKASSQTRTDPVKLARGGADIETIMSRCRLSRAEAELVHSVHAPSGMDKAA